MNRELKVVEDIELNSQATLVGQLSFVDTVVHVVGFGLSCFFIKWHNISALMSRNACKYCLTSTSYLTELFVVFIVPHVWQNFLVFWLTIIGEDTL